MNSAYAVRAAVLVLCLTAAGAASGQNHAQRDLADYPTKPLRFVVPSTPGGGADVLARAIGPKLAKAFGKPVVIENRAGAGGIIGYEIVSQAPPDGYTLLIVAGGYTLNPGLYAKLPFDTVRDFERVSQIACAPNLLVVHNTVPTIAEAGLPGFEVNNCYGILVPARTPKAIIDKLHGEIVRVLRAPEMRAYIENNGYDVVGSTPEQFNAFTKADIAKWARELKAAGIQPQ